DADAAWECVKSFGESACVIVKHANPCGAAQAQDTLTAYKRAFSTDPASAFGGIIAFNRAVDRATAGALSTQFGEVLIAPEYDAQALALLGDKANVRVLRVPFAPSPQTLDLKRVGGGLLVQTSDSFAVQTVLKIVTRREPTAEELADLQFAWHV